jgi:hypothetical protein
LPFHSIVALGCAIKCHKKLYGSMDNISKHTSFLSNRLYTGLSKLQHFNGVPICATYTDLSCAHPYTEVRAQGAKVAFNILDANGRHVGHQLVERLANEKDIYLRAGGLCNPGGIATCLKVEPWQFKRSWSAGYRCGNNGDFEVIHGKPTGVVRASLGAMSTRADVDTFLDFIGKTFVERGTIAKGNSKASICQGPRGWSGFSSITAVRDHLDEDDFLSLKSQRPKSQHDTLLQGKQPILEFKEKTCGFSHVKADSAIHLPQMNDF